MEKLKSSNINLKNNACLRLKQAVLKDKTGLVVVSAAGFTGTCSGRAIDTAIGCVPLGNLTEFATFFFRWGLGIAGGVGFLFLIYSSFIIMTSAGDPKRLQNGKELLMSAVSGIILLIFSVFVLRLIGVNLLGLF